MDLTRRSALSGLVTLPLAPSAFTAQVKQTHALVSSAQAQIGVTTLYDPAYVRLDYPNGDVSKDRGVCIDVVIRAYRDAFDFDFQKAIHDDMRTNFAAYPKIWGLSRPDRNIDHRRVPNVETWLTRHGYACNDTMWQPGDIISCRVGGSLPHIGIIASRRGRDGNFKAIHNIGLGTLEDSRIWAYGEMRRFRFFPATS